MVDKQRMDMSEFAVTRDVAFRVFKIRRNGLLSFNVRSVYRSESLPDSNNSFIAPDRDSARLPRSSNFAPSTSSPVATPNSRGASYGGSYADSNYSGSYAGSDGQRPSEVVYWVEESNVEAPSYHYAVQQSHGDLVDFKECLEIVEEEEGHDVNDLFEIVVVESGERIQLQLPPYVYASYLGYVDIANYLLSHPDLKLAKGKFVTKNHARKAAKWSPALA